MRIRPQTEQIDSITAAIFNRLDPTAEPTDDYHQLTDEEGTEQDCQQWKSIEKWIKAMPPDALTGLSGLLQDLHEARQHGYVRGLVFAARIAYRRWQTEQARDLLIEADIMSLEALQACGAGEYDIDKSSDLFRDWSPSEEQIWAAQGVICPSQ